MNTRSIQGIIALVIGLIFSIWLGSSLMTDQLTTLAMFGGGSILLLAAASGRRIWLFAILLATIDVPIIRGIGTAEIGRMLFVSFSLAMFMMRRLDYRFRIGELELWLLAIILCVFQVYLRNPVGLNIMGGGSVGGKPYVFMAVAIMSSWILSTLVVPARELKWTIWISLFGRFIGEPLGLLRGSAGIIDAETGQMGGRVGVFRDIGNTMARFFVAFRSPLHNIFQPGWALFMLISVLIAAASGYRNSIASIGLTYAIAIAYYSGFRGLMGSCFVGGFALLSLALFNLAAPLPKQVQRALSPFPGTWDKAIVKDADQSTEWRWQMWEEALTTDRWIQNKVIGDGLGMSRRELQMNKALDEEGGGATVDSDLTNQQVNMLITGSYHSGPVQTIRTVGYVGLLVLLLAQIRLAVHAHRQIRRCWGSEWAPVALFFCIPIISSPIFFVFVFGTFDMAVAAFGSGMAMIRLMERNLPLPSYIVRGRRGYVPLVHRKPSPRAAR